MTQSVDELLAERQKTHGEYADHARVTQALKRVLEAEPTYAALPDVIKETLDMVAHKLGRVMTGNPFVKDHYDDVAGYARLVSQRINDAQTGLKAEYLRHAPESAPADEIRLIDADVGRSFRARNGDIVRIDKRINPRGDKYEFSVTTNTGRETNMTGKGTYWYSSEVHPLDLVARAD